MANEFTGPFAEKGSIPPEFQERVERTFSGVGIGWLIIGVILIVIAS